MPHRFTIGCALPLDGVGQRLTVTEKHVEHEHRSDDQQGQPQGPINGDAEHDHADGGHHQVGGGGQARANGDLVAHDHDVEAGHDAQAGQHPVVPGNVVPGASPEQRKRHRGKKEGEGEMDQAGIGVGHHQADAGDLGQVEGQVGGNVELEQRPDECHRRNQVSLPTRRAPGPCVNGCDEIVRARSLAIVCHCLPPLCRVF